MVDVEDEMERRISLTFLLRNKILLLFFLTSLRVFVMAHYSVTVLLLMTWLLMNRHKINVRVNIYMHPKGARNSEHEDPWRSVFIRQSLRNIVTIFSKRRLECFRASG